MFCAKDIAVFSWKSCLHAAVSGCVFWGDTGPLGSPLRATDLASPAFFNIDQIPDICRALLQASTKRSSVEIRRLLKARNSWAGHVCVEHRVREVRGRYFSASVHTIILTSSCSALKNQCITKYSTLRVLNIYVFIWFKLLTQYFTATHSYSNDTCIG